MTILQQLYEIISPILPSSGVLILSILLMVGIRWVLDRRYRTAADRSFRRQIITMVMALAALLAVIMTLPISDDEQGQLLSLIGILLSAAIALSATTFVGNIMAGLMLRTIRSFRPGDFVKVGDHFGRISEQGLFHVEIQTEDRDLTTMPNLYLVTNPVLVIHSDGTLVKGDVSLGYDVARSDVERLLIDAATETGLSDPFVYVTSLGDFSVSYRVAGMLKETKHLLSTRSRLHKRMLDHLHGGGIEIVSPTFMNTRAMPENRRFVPETRRGAAADIVSEPAPETLVFDKADEAESLERLRQRLGAIDEEVGTLKSELKEADQPAARDQIEKRLANLSEVRRQLSDIIDQRTNEG